MHTSAPRRHDGMSQGTWPAPAAARGRFSLPDATAGRRASLVLGGGPVTTFVDESGAVGGFLGRISLPFAGIAAGLAVSWAAGGALRLAAALVVESYGCCGELGRLVEEKCGGSCGSTRAVDMRAACT